MCGRAYETYTDDELRMRYVNERWKRNPSWGSQKVTRNYNLSPTQTAPVVLVRDAELSVEFMRWGLIPFWAKDVKSVVKFSLINARGEEIEEKRAYKQAFERRRCIVPLSGFFEWLRPQEGPKRPFAIHLKNEPIMSVAGVWEHWQSKDTGELIDSFSIITTSANDAMSGIHDRMPVILERKDEAAWLDPENHDVAALKKLLVPSHQQLELFEVSTRVNSPRNNSPEVLEPVGKQA
jgi:putative SOS response-associated peptidase YedK